MLLSLGADVTVAARKPKDLELIEAYGAKALGFEKVSGFTEPSLIFNTVPAHILSCVLLALGAAAILSLLPCWIWLMMIGVTLIVIAVIIIRNC